MTAPWSALQVISSSMLADPVWSKIWQLISRTPLSGVPSPPAMPQMPVALLLTAPMIPATWVPWSLGVIS